MKPAALKRILMTADPVGGVWIYALELAQALGEYGVDVALATMGARLSREQRREVRMVPNLELFESSFKLEWMDEPWADVQRAGDWLLGLEDTLAPNLVHLNGYAHAPLPWRAPRIVVGHSCVCSWWRAVKGEPWPDCWTRYAQMVQTGLLAADLVIAPTRAMLNTLKKLYGPFPGRVICNGRDPALFKPGKKEPFIFSAGRVWDEAKNIEALVKIAPHLPWPIYIAGQQKHPSGRKLSRSRLHYLGRVAARQLPPWYGRASIYAHPARYEPFGLSILEAGLAGCALVLGDIPSLREIWSGAAQFVDPGDSEQLEATIRKWIEQPASLREWAACAQCRAIQFTPMEMAKRYLAAYADVIAAKSQPSPAMEVACAS